MSKEHNSHIKQTEIDSIKTRLRKLEREMNKTERREKQILFCFNRLLRKNFRTAGEEITMKDIRKALYDTVVDNLSNKEREDQDLIDDMFNE